MRKTKNEYYVLVPFDTGGIENGIEHLQYEIRGGMFNSLKSAQTYADGWESALVVKVISGEPL